MSLPSATPAFPTSLTALFDAFPDNRAAFLYLVAARWPGGKFACPRCCASSAYVLESRMLLECKACRWQVSATSGTVMHRSHTELRKWLLAAWLVVTDKRGTSAKQLERQLGVSYETGFQMLHKLRAGMVAPDRGLLEGYVEVDETEIGSARRGRKGAPEKMVVIGAVERRLNARTGRHYAGRLRFRLLPRGRRHDEMLLFVTDVVAPASVVVTDGHDAYEDLPKLGFKHAVESASRGMDQDRVLPSFHRAVSNLKAWLGGTYHGAVSKKHLQAYLNEYVFRFNRRGNLYAAFLRVLQIGTNTAGPEYGELYADEGEADGWEHMRPASPGRTNPASR